MLPAVLHFIGALLVLLLSARYFTRSAEGLGRWMRLSPFVIGIFIGSFAAAVLSGTFSFRSVPDMWRERFGAGIGKRGAAAFIGGVVAMIGARLADG